MGTHLWVDDDVRGSLWAARRLRARRDLDLASLGRARLLGCQRDLLGEDEARAEAQVEQGLGQRRLLGLHHLRPVFVPTGKQTAVSRGGGVILVFERKSASQRWSLSFRFLMACASRTQGIRVATRYAPQLKE